MTWRDGLWIEKSGERHKQAFSYWASKLAECRYTTAFLDVTLYWKLSCELDASFRKCFRLTSPRDDIRYRKLKRNLPVDYGEFCFVAGDHRGRARARPSLNPLVR